MKLEFDLAFLKAASYAMARKDNRHMLNGVYISAKNQNLQSTQGHIAFLSKPETVTVIEPDEAVDGFIMPVAMVDALSAIKLNKSATEAIRKVNLAFDRESKIINATLNNINFMFRAVEGQFPNLTKVYNLDRREKETEQSIDYTYLEIVAKINKALLTLPNHYLVSFDGKIYQGVRVALGRDNLSSGKSIFRMVNNTAQLIVMAMKEPLSFTLYSLK